MGLFMQIKDIENYRENNRLEAKAAQGGLPKSVWETVCAFANTAGGIVILGAKERKDKTLEIIGLADAHKMLDDFWNAAMSKNKLSAKFCRMRMSILTALMAKMLLSLRYRSLKGYCGQYF